MKNSLTLIFLFALLQLAAQDPHFSNYTNSPLNLNPALTGQINDASNRLTLAYRGQWKSVLGSAHFRTTQATYDRQFCGLAKGDYAALGLSVLGDERGDFPLQRAEVKLSGAYMKLLSGNSKRQTYLGLGGEIGAIHQRLGGGERTYDTQFDDPSAAGELLDRDNVTLLDGGIGISFYSASKDPLDLSYHLGGAAKHLGKPAYSFLGVGENAEESYLQSLYMLQAGLKLPVSGKWAFSLSALAMDQQPFRQYSARIEWLYELSEGMIVGAGVGWRQVKGLVPSSISDAWIPGIAIKSGGWNVQFSYDFNISPLRKASNSFGAFEMSVSTRFGDGGCSNVYCPGMF